MTVWLVDVVDNVLVGLIFHEPVNRSTPDLRSATRKTCLASSNYFDIRIYIALFLKWIGFQCRPGLD
jgi:hypothetical protein